MISAFFTADYRDGRVIFGGKSYPAGVFATHLLNQFYIKDTAARIAVFRDDLNYHILTQLSNRYLSITEFVKTGANILEALKALPKLRPFDGLNIEEIRNSVRTLFTEENGQKICEYFADKAKLSLLTQDEIAAGTADRMKNVTDFSVIESNLTEIKSILLFLDSLADDLILAHGSLLKFCKRIDEVERLDEAHSVQSVDEYRTLKKAMALYAKYEYKFDEETVAKIAVAIGKSVKDTKEIIRAGIDSTHYTDFYRKYADEDAEITAEDVTVDTISNPERLFFKQWQAEALFTAYESLDYRERSMVADHLGFCPECYGVYELSKDENGNSVKLLRKGKAYIDLAAEHMLSSPDTAFQIVNGAYEKMLIELAIDEYIHIVELRLTSADNNSVTYEYCADHNNDWGEICYFFGEDDYDVKRYIYADRKGDFFFATAGEWIMHNTGRKHILRYMVVSL